MYNSRDLVWVGETPLKEFSNKALVIVSRLARLLRDSDGDKLSLQDPALPKKIAGAVAENNDPKLGNLFDQLVAELRAFSESRGQPRYRGSVQSEPNTNVSSQKTSERTYRGAIIPADGVNQQTDQKAAVKKTTKKKVFYRGVEVTK